MYTLDVILHLLPKCILEINLLIASLSDNPNLLFFKGG